MGTPQFLGANTTAIPSVFPLKSMPLDFLPANDAIVGLDLQFVSSEVETSELEASELGTSDDLLNEPDSEPASVPHSQDREEVLLGYLPLVTFLARRIHANLPAHIELEDLVNAGILGLLDAYNKFDSTKNVRFSSYAHVRIRGSIIDSLRSLDWGPRELRRKGRQLARTLVTLTARLNRAPMETETAQELGLSLSEYQRLVRDLKGLEIGHLQEFRFDDSGEELLASVPAAPEESPYLRCMQRERSRHLREAVAALPHCEGEVIRLYYIQNMTMKEVGKTMGVVESRVSQIHSSALVRLRKKLAARRVPVLKLCLIDRASHCSPSPESEVPRSNVKE